MAPYSSFSTLHQARSDREAIKLRKPMVEKMRRDRINGCIEQLKVLLEKELHREASPKLEKADVLEMTVSFLKQQLGHGPGAPTAEGHSAPYRELKGGHHKDAPGAPHAEGRRLRKVRRVPHSEVQRPPHREVHRVSRREVGRAPHTEVQRGAVQRVPRTEVHRLPQTEAWIQGSIKILQPRDMVSNSAPMWRPW